MRQVNLTRQEKKIEETLMKGKYINVDKQVFDEIARTIADRKKDAVLNIRVNTKDLKTIKQKAQKLGIKYQTFISEVLHKIARAS